MHSGAETSATHRGTDARKQEASPDIGRRVESWTKQIPIELHE